MEFNGLCAAFRGKGVDVGAAAPVKFSLGGGGGGVGGGGGGGAKRKAEDSKSDAKAKAPTKFDWQKSRKIDPMDPLGEEGGKNSMGINGERMADSTASGPLFQQRPYPAPGSVLRGAKK